MVRNYLSWRVGRVRGDGGAGGCWGGVVQWLGKGCLRCRSSLRVVPGYGQGIFSISGSF